MNSTLSKIALLICCLANTYAFAAHIDFYGHSIQLESEQLRSVQTTRYFSKSSIGRALYALESKNHDNLLSQVYDAKLAYNLDDIGVVIFTKKIASQTTSNTNTQSLLQYFLLGNLGYDVQLTFTKTSLSCFGFLSQAPASSVYIIHHGKKYINLDFHNERTMGTRYLYNSEFKGGKRIAFTGAMPRLDAKTSNRNFKWVFQGKVYQLSAVNNQSFTEYLNDLPQFKLGKDYTKVASSNQFKTSVLAPLKDYLNDMQDDEQKANFLLSFVQSSFAYKTDQAQYGREKYNYPEETISSPFSDCEDRTILLAFLYKRLLNFESVMLHFDKDRHVCLGVKLPKRSNSYSFTYKNEAYMVCEPTGIGYKVGVTSIPLSRISGVIDLF